METDANRNVLTRTEYEPYGLSNRPTLDGPGFTGHVQDAATGLTYMQQRYYDPVIGRFLSVDPVTAYSSPGANFNRYWYANSSPYRFYDPNGRFALDDNNDEPPPPPPPQPNETLIVNMDTVRVTATSPDAPSVQNMETITVKPTPLPEYTPSGIRALYSCHELGTCVPLDQVRRGDQWLVGGVAATAGAGALVAGCVAGGCAAIAGAAQSPAAQDMALRACVITGLCTGNHPDQWVNDVQRVQRIGEAATRAGQQGMKALPWP